MAAHVELAGDLLGRKMNALAAQASQTSGLIESLGEREFRRWAAVESFRQAVRRSLPVG